MNWKRLNWKRLHVLVTGAGGFIGSHLVERLVELGADVTAFCRYTSRGTRGFVPTTCRVIYGDIREYASVERVSIGQDVIFHLAAQISVPYSFEHALETMQTNVNGTYNVLQSAHRSAYVRRLVIASSSEVYGTAQYAPIDEKHPKNPQSPYAASKIAADALALSYHAVYATPVTVVRPFNTYGPRQSDRAIIPTLIAQALWRDRVEVGNLDSLRDFTYVSDTVEGFIKAAESADAIGQEVNLGTGREASIRDLVVLIGKHSGRHFGLAQDAQRTRSSGAEVRRLLSDNRKAQSLLGWAPQVEFEDGLQRTIEFARAHRELYDPEHYRI